MNKNTAAELIGKIKDSSHSSADAGNRFWLLGQRADQSTYIRWSGKTLKGAERARGNGFKAKFYAIVDRETGEVL